MADLDHSPTTTQTQPTRQRGDGRIFLRGSKLWCSYYVDGIEHRESTKTDDPIKAEKYLRARLKEVHAHELDPTKPFISQRDRRRKIDDLMDGLKADFEIRAKWNPQVRTNIEHVRSAFGTIRAMNLTKEDVDDYISQRLAAGYANASINRTTQLLKQGFVLAELPAPKIRRLEERDNKRRGFFTEQDVRRVLSNLSTELADFVLFAWLTGMRKGEIASLRWEDVDGNELVLRGENAKNGEERVIPFEGELADLIERRKRARQFKLNGMMMLSAFIFHRRGERICEFRKSWARACCMAGLGKMVCPTCRDGVDAKHKCEKCGVTWAYEKLKYTGKIIHDFRRTAVRDMVRAGVPETVAMSISGHKTRSIFDRYNITDKRDQREALRATQLYRQRQAEQQTVVAMPATVN
jgi:integrase